MNSTLLHCLFEFRPELMSGVNADGTQSLSSTSYGFDEQVYPLSSSYTFGVRIIY